jgi:hypothetical protein
MQTCRETSLFRLQPRLHSFTYQRRFHCFLKRHKGQIGPHDDHTGKNYTHDGHRYRQDLRRTATDEMAANIADLVLGAAVLHGMVDRIEQTIPR